MDEEGMVVPTTATAHSISEIVLPTTISGASVPVRDGSCAAPVPQTSHAHVAAASVRRSRGIMYGSGTQSASHSRQKGRRPLDPGFDGGSWRAACVFAGSGGGSRFG